LHERKICLECKREKKRELICWESVCETNLLKLSFSRIYQGFSFSQNPSLSDPLFAALESLLFTLKHSMKNAREYVKKRKSKVQTRQKESVKEKKTQKESKRENKRNKE
jgi:hypothetical protein